MAADAGVAEDPPDRVGVAEPTAAEIEERVENYAESARLAKARKRAILAIALCPDQPHSICDWRCECCASASA